MKTKNYTFTCYVLHEKGDHIKIENSEGKLPSDEERLWNNIINSLSIKYEFGYDIEEGAIIATTFYDENNEAIVDLKILGPRDWEDLTDSTVLVNKKYKILDSGNMESAKLIIKNEHLALKESQKNSDEQFRLDHPEFDFSTLETVKSWDEIKENFMAFQDIDKNENTRVLNLYSSFFHWYYLPEKDLFAPSKFLGYKNMTIQKYKSLGSGGDTQKALDKFFVKLDKGSEQFLELYNQLAQLSKNNIGKDLKSEVKDGRGGIYVPKDYIKE